MVWIGGYVRFVYFGRLLYISRFECSYINCQFLLLVFIGHASVPTYGTEQGSDKPLSTGNEFEPAAWEPPSKPKWVMSDPVRSCHHHGCEKHGYRFSRRELSPLFSFCYQEWKFFTSLLILGFQLVMVWRAKGHYKGHTDSAGSKLKTQQFCRLFETQTSQLINVTTQCKRHSLNITQ